MTVLIINAGATSSQQSSPLYLVVDVLRTLTPATHQDAVSASRGPRIRTGRHEHLCVTIGHGHAFEFAPSCSCSPVRRAKLHWVHPSTIVHHTIPSPGSQDTESYLLTPGPEALVKHTCYLRTVRSTNAQVKGACPFQPRTQLLHGNSLGQAVRS